MSKPTKLSSLKPDARNANKHTQRGRGHLETSIRKFGFLEPGVLDKNDTIVAGNQRAEICAELGMDDAIIIESDGTRPIYVRQTHLDLNTPEGREAAIALNRVAQTSIELDGDVLAEFIEEGADLSSFFFDNELAILLGDISIPEDPKELWEDKVDMGTEANAHRQLTLYFKTPESVEAFAALLDQSINDNTKSLWYPAKKD